SVSASLRRRAPVTEVVGREPATAQQPIEALALERRSGVADRTSGGRDSTWISRVSSTIAARSTALLSSRTLPGQRYVESAASAASENFVALVRVCGARSARKRCASS